MIEKYSIFCVKCMNQILESVLAFCPKRSEVVLQAKHTPTVDCYSSMCSFTSKYECKLGKPV